MGIKVEEYYTRKLSGFYTDDIIVTKINAQTSQFRTNYINIFSQGISFIEIVMSFYTLAIDAINKIKKRMTSQSIISLFVKSESYFIPEYFEEYKDQMQRQITRTLFQIFWDNGKGYVKSGRLLFHYFEHMLVFIGLQVQKIDARMTRDFNFFLP